MYWKYILITGIVGLVGAQAYIKYAAYKTENQKYNVLYNKGSIEIRYYPKSIMASVSMNVNKYKELSGSGFQVLASYIFGSNQNKKEIAMTSPVHMDMGDTLSTMSFVMPSEYSLEDLPQPNNPNISLHESKEEYTISIEFGGYATDKVISDKTKELKDWIQLHSIAVDDNFRYLGYNPPYEVINRRNEIIVAITMSQPELDLLITQLKSK
jgi:hypothetical protein